MCSHITSFYQLAVKQHLGNLGEIIAAIRAIPLHLGANRDNASVNHKYCAKGSSCGVDTSEPLQGAKNLHFTLIFLV